MMPEHRWVLERLIGDCRRSAVARRGNSLTGAEARAAFSKVAIDIYGCRTGKSPYCDPVASLIDEPAVGSPVVPILKGLPPEFAEHDADEGRVLAGGGTDPAVIRDLRRRYSRNSASHSEYVAYHSRAEAAGLFYYVTKDQVRAPVGFLCVWKSK